MNKAISKDGTAIAFDRIGEGPALILVDGALCYRASGPNGPLAEMLKDRFAVYTYDRRGRGDSDERKPYSIEREVEDLEALVNAAGGSAFLYGISSGAALVIEAARRLPSIRKVALYEAPYIVDGSRIPVKGDYAARLEAHVSADRRAAAVKLFMKEGVGLPAFVVATMPLMPAWRKLKAVAHTLPYDTALTVACQRGDPLPAEPFASVTIPALVGVGGKSPAWMRAGMKALADALPNAKLHMLDGQTHIVQPGALAPVLAEFFYNEERG
ncbi:alpha/beta hydrolase [Paenibacillus antri]|uniref:Alpha/beta hydrolase n=1 Tax=Paenibacillus antri TaxID=2582848 RepID=A0A5R9G633_9BACL|nr:alpha/beta hydrolase [Paenibacillus antri]TLS48223.1 alpha/beta hydrolase [Paenibacillus antri]